MGLLDKGAGGTPDLGGTTGIGLCPPGTGGDDRAGDDTGGVDALVSGALGRGAVDSGGGTFLGTTGGTDLRTVASLASGVESDSSAGSGDARTDGGEGALGVSGALLAGGVGAAFECLTSPSAKSIAPAGAEGGGGGGGGALRPAELS